MVKLMLRVSGFLRLGEMGRTRPKNPAGLNCSSRVSGGLFGEKARMACPSGVEASAATVNKFTPSKLSESSDTLRYASIVISANDRRITVLSLSPKSECIKPLLKRGLHAMPILGWKLLRSLEHAGIIPLPWKHPLPFLIVPPLKAPCSTTYRLPGLTDTLVPNFQH